MGLLQAASFRGVPFKVVAAQVKKGRRLALHEYPFREGGWAEDMGRALRTYSFSGYLIGDIAPVMQLLLDNAIEAQGPGLLIHPTLGAIQVAVLSAATSVRKDRMRVIEVAFEFVEQGGSIFPSMAIATVVAVLAAADSALTAAGSDLGTSVAPAAAIGPAVTAEGSAVVGSFAGSVALAGGDPTAIVAMAVALPVTDPSVSYGRYGGGSASALLPEGTTVASLQASLAAQRAALAVAASAAVAAAGSFSAATDILGALAALVEAMRAGITDPASQVRVLLSLAGFSYADGAGGSVSVGAAMATMRDGMAAACRRAALVSLARASSSYQPRSYDNAAALRSSLTTALDAEITAAGDAGQDATYGAFKALRASVIQDLTVRGASLPSVVGVSFAVPLPSLVIGQMLYRDASRSDEITAESGAVHPAFCPVSFQALASGMQSLAVTTGATAGSVLVARGSAAGPYHLPPPGTPVGLAVASVTGSTAALSWSASTAGGLAASYLVEVAVDDGTGTWASAGTTTSAGYTVTGLAGLTVYDFRVTATNSAGRSDPAGPVTGMTAANAPNAVTGLAAGTVTANSVPLSWTAPAIEGSHNAATGYAVQYRINGSAVWVTVASGVSGTGYTVAGLIAGLTYQFNVVASNAGGSSPGAAVTVATGAAGGRFTCWGTGGYPASSIAHGSTTTIVAFIDNGGSITHAAFGWSSTQFDPPAALQPMTTFNTGLFGSFSAATPAAAGSYHGWMVFYDAVGDALLVAVSAAGQTQQNGVAIMEPVTVS